MVPQPEKACEADFAGLGGFLAAFHPADEPVCLRAFKPRGAEDSPENRPRKWRLTTQELARPENLQTLAAWNDHLGIYFVVNAGGDRDHEISRFTAFFCERDDLPVAGQHQMLDAAPLPPSIRVETLKSVHAYWLIAGDCAQDEWRDVQARLIAHFASDASIKNPSRVMRLPYFHHLSPAAGGVYQRQRVELVHFEPERRYTVADMRRAFPAANVQGRYANWAALKAELARRLLAHPTARQNAQGKWDVRGVCHNGSGDSGLFYDPSTNFTHCNKGCDQAAILRAFGLPERPDGNAAKSPPANEREQEAAASVRVICLANVQAEAVNWLWHPCIPLGKITILEGDPGLGKSWLTCALATATACGYGLPGMTETEPRNVLMLSAEDGLGDTIRPRLDAMHADLSRIFVLDGALTLDETGALLLEAAIIEHRAALVTIDPIVAYTGASADLHRANVARDLMARLSRLAERQQCAVVALRHLTKGGQAKAIYRGYGSIDLTAAARSVLLVGADPENASARGIVQTKNNLAPLADPVGFELRDGEFCWTAASQLTAERILSVGGGEEEPLSRREAEEFLSETLCDGAKPSKEVVQEAQEVGIAERTLRRAKIALQVRSFKQEFTGTWFWALPLDGEGGQPGAKMATPGEVGHLRRNDGDKGIYANQLGEDGQLTMNGHVRGPVGPIRQTQRREITDASE